jgi:hypothetical protein
MFKVASVIDLTGGTTISGCEAEPAIGSVRSV